MKNTPDKEYFWLMAHGKAIAISGLKYVIRTMRWSDLQEFAAELEGARRGKTKGRCARPITADMIAAIAQPTSAPHEQTISQTT